MRNRFSKRDGPAEIRQKIQGRLQHNYHSVSDRRLHEIGLELLDVLDRLTQNLAKQEGN